MPMSFRMGQLAKLINLTTRGVPPLWLSAPGITGTPTLGQAVAYSSGTVSGYPTPSVSTKVLIAGVDVGALPYTIQADDVGKSVVVRRTATNVLGTVSSDSSPVTAIAA